jgi:hypothetical protein
MRTKFQARVYKDWFVFPFCIWWENELMEYVVPTKRLSFHFLWWHFAWTFMKGGAK